MSKEKRVGTVVGVDIDACQGCGQCAAACPREAIHIEGGVAVIDQERCDACGACFTACPQGAIYAVVDAQQEKARLPEPAQPSITAERDLSALPSLRPVRVARKQPRPSTALSIVRFLGREVLPRAASAFVAMWDSRQSRSASLPDAPGSESPAMPAGQTTGRRRGHQHRARHGARRRRP